MNYMSVLGNWDKRIIYQFSIYIAKHIRTGQTVPRLLVVPHQTVLIPLLQTQLTVAQLRQRQQHLIQLQLQHQHLQQPRYLPKWIK